MDANGCLVWPGDEKACLECGIVKPLTDYYFHSRNGAPRWYYTVCKPCHFIRTKRSQNRLREIDPERIRKRARAAKRRYQEKLSGITAEQITDQLARQGGGCGVCGRKEPTSRGWQIDHCHETHQFRGVLCSECNLGLGKLGDSTERVMRALEYLRRAERVVDPLYVTVTGRIRGADRGKDTH